MPIPHHETGPATADELRIVRTNLAAATAALPIAPEMAWAVPQLVKRVRLVAPESLSTTAILRSLIRMPELDEQFAKAFTDSGFLACDAVMARTRWKYDIQDMMAMCRAGGGAQVLDHCRALLARDRARQPIDWAEVHRELRVLRAWFPQLRTLQLLEQLYERLDVLHARSVLVARCCLESMCGGTWAERCFETAGACNA